MKLSEARVIRNVWEAIEDGEITTEQLFARVSDTCKCDPEDVVEALALTEDKR